MFNLEKRSLDIGTVVKYKRINLPDNIGVIHTSFDGYEYKCLNFDGGFDAVWDNSIIEIVAQTLNEYIRNITLQEESPY